VWVGDLSFEQLASGRGTQAVRVISEPGAAHWSRATRTGFLTGSTRSHYHGLLEVHIEQGPGMWKNNVSLAVRHRHRPAVRQYRVNLGGVANHAGSTA